MVKECTFFSEVKHCILIYNILQLPPITYTVERSFNTLRRVDIWLRSTMSEERLVSGRLCIISVHREKIEDK